MGDRTVTVACAALRRRDPGRTQASFRLPEDLLPSRIALGMPALRQMSLP